jgi:two-component system, OmpR family, response regulator
MRPGKPSVLLVDDEEEVRRVMGRCLSAAGYLVDIAGDGRDGLRMFKEGSWDLVIIDRLMPEFGGEKLAEEVRSIAPEIPMILITGLVRADSKVELFDEVLRKPFFPAELLAATTRVLQRTQKTSLNGSESSSLS